ncbi:MAG TPA: DUF3047 domain-containing protein [Nitrospiria bacterium]|jgi:hypothetical protein
MKPSCTLLIAFFYLYLFFGTTPLWAEEGKITLADFSTFPAGWKVSSDESKAKEIYTVIQNNQDTYLQGHGKEKAIRVFKKLSWDSSTFPIVEWKWRVKKWPEDPEAQVYVYISLDKDIFGIPTNIKYVWSQKRAVGSMKQGGFFRPTEVVLQNGPPDPEIWVTQRINAVEDFQKIIGRKPKGEAYGVGFLVDPGVEAEIGKMIGLKE